MPDFHQTVDLKEKMAQKNKPFMPPSKDNPRRDNPRIVPTGIVSTPVQPAPRKKAEGIDEMFNDDEDEVKQSAAGRKEMQSIVRAPRTKYNEALIKKWLFIFAGIIAIFLVYFLVFHKGKAAKAPAPAVQSTGWYAVKLMNNETYYGQIKDQTTDPIVLTNVYYNYDDINKDKAGTPAAAPETGALRLVKRGKENYGPDGTMSIVRIQVVSMEQLKEDSKVLKAILEYEKK